MEERVIELLQQRMNKCMNDQFWGVAAIAALNAFLITQKEVLLGALPAAVYIIALIVAAPFAEYYVYHRHMEYYRAKNDITRRLKAVGVKRPAFMDHESYPWEWSSCVGFTFCTLWILGSSAAAVRVLVT